MAAVMALVTASCGKPDAVDGWPLGVETQCQMADTTPEARALIDDTFRGRFGNAPVVDGRCYAGGIYKLDDESIFLNATPGGLEIHVFTMADGSRHAIAISCPGLSPGHPGQPSPRGPLCNVASLPTSATP